MAAAMCQALPSFYSDYFKKLLIISVSSGFYEKHLVTHDYCSSLKNIPIIYNLGCVSLIRFKKLAKYLKPTNFFHQHHHLRVSSGILIC